MDVADGLTDCACWGKPEGLLFCFLREARLDEFCKTIAADEANATHSPTTTNAGRLDLPLREALIEPRAGDREAQAGVFRTQPFGQVID